MGQVDGILFFSCSGKNTALAVPKKSKNIYSYSRSVVSQISRLKIDKKVVLFVYMWGVEVAGVRLPDL